MDLRLFDWFILASSSLKLAYYDLWTIILHTVRQGSAYGDDRSIMAKPRYIPVKAD